LQVQHPEISKVSDIELAAGVARRTVRLCKRLKSRIFVLFFSNFHSAATEVPNGRRSETGTKTKYFIEFCGTA
jgi:hypothetical protein